jgi:hypothetical protein
MGVKCGGHRVCPKCARQSAAALLQIRAADDVIPVKHGARLVRRDRHGDALRYAAQTSHRHARSSDGESIHTSRTMTSRHRQEIPLLPNKRVYRQLAYHRGSG